MYYPDEVIEEVRQRNDIADVISGYVRLQKKGSALFGLCPFHHEKSPSFSVNTGRQMYHCFGCGVSGNVITFVMEYENYSFTEAVEMLADRAGVKLPKVEYTAEMKAASDLKNTLLEINKLAARYFYYQLRQPQGRIGYEYFKKRKLTDDTIKHFGLGFSNKVSDDLYKYLKSKGYSDDILKQTGLCTIEERGSRDKFWNRVMFPIMDVNNRVIGFGGRVLGDGEPKYLNSPETKLFDKSRNLYGLNYARTARKSNMLLCEGYMDVIALHQAGFTNSVAALGTAFTEQHAMLLKRYTENVILTFDSDGAGIKAALRAIPILKNAGVSVKVINMKPYKDPDEFIKNLGAEEFQKRIDSARNSFMFEIDVLKSNYSLDDPEQKTAFYNKIAQKLVEFEEPLERDNYTQAVSREYFIKYEDLRRLVNSLGNKKGYGSVPVLNKEKADESQEPVKQEVRSSKKKKDPEEGIRRAERLLLTWLIEEPKLFEKIDGIISPVDFVKPLYREAAEAVFRDYAVNGKVNPASILNRFIDNDGNYKEVAALFNAPLEESLKEEEQRKALTEIVRRIKKNSIDTRVRTTTDIGELQELIKAQADLNKIVVNID